MDNDNLEKYFRVLGLPANASLDQVKKAYRKLAVKYHPDRLGPNAEESEVKKAQERFYSVAEAYSILCEHLRIRERIKYHNANAAQATEEAEAGQKIHTTSSYTGQRKIPVSKYRFLAAALAVTAVLGLLMMMLLLEKDQVVIFEKNAPVKTLMQKQPKPADAEDREKYIPDHPGRLSLPVGDYFSLFSTEEDVLRIQGVPQRISGNTWFYGLSTVTFRNGRVVGYDNFDGTLKVRLLPSALPQEVPTRFTLGSTASDVLMVQGTPTRVAGNVWYYGLDRVIFRDGRVVGYDNMTGRLKVELFPRNIIRAPKKYFSIGSSADHVLAVQGTPTRVEGNRWYYGLSEVVFRDGKVAWANNVSNNLKFVALKKNRGQGP
ncbi:J domain-containing protein [Thermodesulforhabdus norvegica]|nr:J domain-containing protein [Thermodesulforhabdus norvegica]